MTEHTLWDEIARLRKLPLDLGLRKSLEEAVQLLTDGRYLEAEALIENTEARVRYSLESAGVVRA
jgi:hypothetical protein